MRRMMMAMVVAVTCQALPAIFVGPQIVMCQWLVECLQARCIRHEEMAWLFDYTTMPSASKYILDNNPSQTAAFQTAD